MRILSFVPVLLVSVAACSNPNGPSGVNQVEELSQRQQQFQTTVGDTYRVTLENNCFCPLDVMRPVRLTVRNGALTDVTRVSDNTAVPASDWRAYRTVVQVFSEINTGLTTGARRVFVDYDDTYGYPRETLIDYQLAADAFIGFKLRELEVIR